MLHVNICFQLYVTKQTRTNTQQCGTLYLRHQRAMITQLPATLRLYFGTFDVLTLADKPFHRRVFKSTFKVPLNTGRSSPIDQEARKPPSVELSPFVLSSLALPLNRLRWQIKVFLLRFTGNH